MGVHLQIGSVTISENHPVFIIAEIGQNHQGDINTAKQLIRVAKECGANCVKFQKTEIQEKFNKAALEKPYTSGNSWGKTYGEHKKFLEFSNEEFLNLQKYASSLGIMFTASAMDPTSLKFLQNSKVPFIKIGSGDSNNLLMIEEAATGGFPLIISTGMLNLSGVDNIYTTVTKHHKNFALLHCVSAYPTPNKDLNLSVINLYKKKFPDIVIGYSGHELGTDATITAVALGAKIIERHITLDKNQKGSDHKCSLNPEELKSLIERIRATEVALGKPEKIFQESEITCFKKLGKSLVAAEFLPKGHVLKLTDLKVKVAHPKGLDASSTYFVVNKTVNEDIEKDAPITQEKIENFI